MSPRILYFVPECEATTSAILHSTVLAEAKYLHDNGFDVLFIGSDISTEKASEAEENIKKRYGIKARVFCNKSWNIPVVSNLMLPRKILKLSTNIINEYQPTHVWAQLIFSSAVGRKIAKQHSAISIFDVPAIFSLEVEAQKGKGPRFWVTRWLEKRELTKTDRLAGVTHKLAEYAENLSGRNDMVVIPCCVDTKKFHFDIEARQQIRQECGFADNEKVICYSGGVYKWQKIPEIIDICLKMSRKQDDYKFLFLTQQIEELKQIVLEKNLEFNRCVIKSCLPYEVPRYLSAADIGIVIRDNNLMNNTASPMKIGEYLACGLAVILTKGIGDYSELVAKTGVGCVLDDNEDAAQQIVDFIEKSDFGELRGKAISCAHKYVSWDSHYESLKQLFRMEISS